MKKRALRLAAELALPCATFARRRLMDLEGWLLRVRYFSDIKPSADERRRTR